MHLARLSLRNFRAFFEAELTFESTGLALVAGANNAGKSALLSAIDLVAGRPPAPASRFHGSDQPAVVEVEFRLSEEDRATVLRDAAFAQAWVRETPVFRTVILRWSDEGNAGSLFLAAVETESLNATIGPIATARTSGGVQTVSWINAVGLASAAPKDAPREWQEISADNTSTGSPGDVLRGLPGAGALSDLFVAWSAGVYHFSAIRTGTPRTSQIGSITPTLDPSGGNLAQCLAYHSSQRSDVWYSVRRIMKEILPDVGELITPMQGSEVEIAFVDPNSQQRRNLKDLGSGVEQLLMITYVGETQPAGAMILVEEPETSLHPAAQRELLRHLLRFSEARVVVATTHSPVLLDNRPQGPGGSWLVRRRRGRSELFETHDDIAPTLGEIGVRLSDVLSADRVLLVEGESDAALLRVWFPDLLMSKRAAVVSLGGSDRAYHLETVQRVLEGVDTLDRPVLFLRDRDELGVRRLESFVADSRIVVLQRRELENYLLDDVDALIAALNWRRAQPESVAKEVFDPDRLQAALRHEADKLRDIVVLKRVVEEAGPPRLLPRGTVAEVAKQPTLEVLQSTFRERLDEAQRSERMIADAWGTQSRLVEGAWEERWRELVPGADVLTAVWRRAGARYSKSEDGTRIAAAMKTPPREIGHLVTSFLAPGD